MLLILQNNIAIGIKAFLINFEVVKFFFLYFPITIFFCWFQNHKHLFVFGFLEDQS